VPWCFALIGIALDWRLSFEWFDGKDFFLSSDVLGRALLIVLACASAPFLTVFVTRELKWRGALVVFFALSAVLYDVLSIHWDVQRLTAR
jgi:hypothetical protein